MGDLLAEECTPMLSIVNVKLLINNKKILNNGMARAFNQPRSSPLLSIFEIIK